ncbi:hypothetical protein DPMN_171926 [Dreissena polymorpha]|uniref:Uncharacterized protein n=1 Tax=Dreissena polymorpha TaxID=45954 RepID=A0A9D4DYW9_DREPO|nr:hypothetical protein DPMN_171926 [Dreissena polymorpha]
MEQLLSSLTQLRSISINANKGCPGLWDALNGLNIKKLSMSGEQREGLRVDHSESLSQSLTSLTKLETFKLHMHT